MCITLFLQVFLFKNFHVNCNLLLTLLQTAGHSQCSGVLKWLCHLRLLFFLSAINPNACRAAGRGLQPKGVRVREVADFKVFTKGAGSGTLNVSVKGPSESVISLFSVSPLHTYLVIFFPLLGHCLFSFLACI